MRRRLGSYCLRMGVLLAICAFTAVAMLRVGDSPWQTGPALVLGVVFAQFGFLAHDAAHRQVFASHHANEWGARVLSTVGIGLSYGWWTHKHNRHHRSPNQEGRDPDIAAGGLAFTPRSAAERPRWLRPVTRRQGYLFFPMLLLEGLNLHWAGLQTLAKRADVPFRRLEASLIFGRFAVYVASLLFVMSPGNVVLFLGVQLAVFGFVLGAAFAPNHKGMPIVPAEKRMDFLRRQVLMSRNISGGRLVDLAMGGLNYQIEHHLFPSMPRANLRRAQPVVRVFCQEHGIPYAETSLVASYGIVVRYLNNVGLQARDPFTCPFVEAYRD
jgi:fatty acid desaturase